MNPVATCATGAGFTFTVSAVVEILEPHLLPVYLGACVVVYGVAGAVVAVREGWVGKARQEATERLSWADAANHDGPTGCESCLSQLAVREVILDGDEQPFAVCDSCTPNPDVVMTGASSTSSTTF